MILVTTTPNPSWPIHKPVLHLWFIVTLDQEVAFSFTSWLSDWWFKIHKIWCWCCRPTHGLCSRSFRSFDFCSLTLLQHPTHTQHNNGMLCVGLCWLGVVTYPASVDHRTCLELQHSPCGVSNKQGAARNSLKHWFYTNVKISGEGWLWMTGTETFANILLCKSSVWAGHNAMFTFWVNCLRRKKEM